MAKAKEDAQRAEKKCKLCRTAGISGCPCRSGKFWALLCLLLGLCLGGWFLLDRGEANVDNEDIEVSDLDARLHSPMPPFLLDVREPFEYEQARIRDAILIPLGALPTRLDELPKDRPIVVYCRSGRRSARAVAFLRERGFNAAQNLTGGINAWMQTHSCDPKSLVC